MFAHFLMRRTAFLALALTAPMVAFAGGAPSTQHPKPHHPTVHHPKPHHPAPHHPRRSTLPLERSRQQQLRADAAHNRRIAKMHTKEDAHLKTERLKGRAIQKEARRRARSERKSSRKTHPTATVPGNTVGESRLERERLLERSRAEALRTRFDEGYKAGYQAGLEAARKERVSACLGTPGETPRNFGAKTLASAAPTSKAVARADATDAASNVPATDASALPAGDPSAAAADLSAQKPKTEPTSLDLAPAVHQPPVTLQASLRMLHERMPPPLRGSLASLERQNERLEAEGLQRIEDNSDLENRIAHGLLVPLPVSDGLNVNPGLPDLRRYCRPWTAEFLTDLAEMHDAVFHRSLRVDSAVRTVDYQERLRRINANAAPATGNIASPHETGATIDIAKRGMTWREIGWMRHYLLTLQDDGLIDVEEEFRQACFHITVYDTYWRLQPVQNSAGIDVPYDGDRGSDTAALQPRDSRGQ